MLSDKVVVITGGAGLIGQEFIKAVIQYNGIAVIADINEDTGKKVQQTLSSELSTDRIDFVQLDITSKDSLENLVSYLHTKYGKIDALINNAYPRSNNYGRHFFDIEFKDLCEFMNLHIGGYFLVSQQLALYFKNQGYGNIINVSSVYGVVAPRFEIYKDTKMTTPFEYAAVKSSLIHVTKYMAKYFKGLNIRVNAISPGGIFDNQPESFIEKYREQCISKGMLDKSDLQGTIIYLLSDMSQFVNGQNIIVDDGFTL